MSNLAKEMNVQADIKLSLLPKQYQTVFTCGASVFPSVSAVMAEGTDGEQAVILSKEKPKKMSAL